MSDISRYWIDSLKGTKEFKVLSQVEGLEVDNISRAISQLVDDQFIHTATEKGISRREKLLDIHPYADDTLEDRRFRVLSHWNSSIPYTYITLKRTLNTLCGENGYTMQLDNGNYSLLVRVELTAKRMEQEVRDMTRKMIPANLVLTVELRYRQHKELKRYTNAELRAFRHRELREEDLT